MENKYEEQIKQMSKDMLSKIIKSKLFIVIAVAIVVLFAFYGSFFVYIQPNEVGLKQINISFKGKPGLQHKEYYAGWHFKIPVMQEFLVFPRDLLVFELADERSSQSQNSFFYQRVSSPKYFSNQKYIPPMKYMRQGAANIQTNDGFYVYVDVSIIFRILNPYLMATVLGRTSDEYMQNGIAKKAESILKDSFGKLTTEEFYNSPLRMAKTVEAKVLFNQKLEPEGLRVEHVLIRYFEYSSEIQRNIEEKKLKDQMVFKEQSEGRAAIEEAELKKVRSEGEASILVELQKGQAYVTRLNAEKEAYRRKKEAAGNLLVKLAEAKKIKMINDAYKEKGSERIVGMEMAKVLNGVDLIIIPSDGKSGVNPLDLDSMINLFGAY